MIYVALDLSVNSTGICIADTETRECWFGIVDPSNYAKSDIRGHKFVKSLHNGRGVANAIAKTLLPYRHEDIQVVIESVGFGFLKSRTNSATDLIFEGAIVANKLLDVYDAGISYVEPGTHKKKFTGHGNATKAMSIAQMLHWFPVLRHFGVKLDDIADAMSLMTTALPDIRMYQPKLLKVF